MIQKTKHLHNITIESCSICTRLTYNINTNHIGIGNIYNYRKLYYQNNKKDCLLYKEEYYKINRSKINKDRKKYRKNQSVINFLGKNIQTDLPKVKPEYVYHHVIYDHLNKDKYVVMMSRAKHASLHVQMRYKGIEIQHINVRVNDFKGF